MAYSHGIRWNDELIIKYLNEVVSKMNIDYFPTHKEIEDFYGNEGLTNKISEKGTDYWAKKLNLPLKDSETKLGLIYEKKAIKDIYDNTGLNSELMIPRFPYDLLTNKKVKVDVKASHCYVRKGVVYFTFNLEKKCPTCDIFILYCLEDDETIIKTIIFPANLVVGKSQIGVGMNSKWDLYRDKWDYIVKFNDFYKDVIKQQ